MENVSVLQLKNVYFERIEFDRDEIIPESFTPQFTKSYKQISETEFEIKLKCRIYCDDKKLLEIILVGVFDNKEPDLELRKALNEENTISILFPYLRAEISLITTQPNFPTLNLPVMNINAMLANQQIKDEE